MSPPSTPEDRPLFHEEIAEYRQRARETLAQLQEQGLHESSSWVRPSSDDDDDNVSWLAQRSERCRYFDTHGFLVLEEFSSPTEIHALKEQMKTLADEYWHPEEDDSLDTFGTDASSNTKRGDYFLDSSNRVHYFAEPTALDAHGKLKPELRGDKLAALNKAGHGMHNIPGSFQDYTLSTKMKDLVLDLGWKDPVVPQSMYIFKQPRVGGTVHSHQDSTFLYTTPRQTCLGLWLALDDATLENGCLWVRPGSHREPLRRQFIRNPKYFDQPENGNVSGEETSKLTFRIHDENHDGKVTWEGSLPESLSAEGFVPVEVKAGDLVTFCGTLDHLSLPNFSDQQRHTFQLHLVEGQKEGVEWSHENWLQYPEGEPFMQLIK